MIIIIIEGAVLGIGGLLYHKVKHKDENEFKNKWNSVMKATNTKNNNDQTYEILEYIPKAYGCDCIISIPIGLGYEKLYKLIPTLETAYGSNIISDLVSNKRSAYIRVAVDKSKLSNKDIIRFKWHKIMNSNNKDTFNQDYASFKIVNIKEQLEYGYDLTIKTPTGLNYKKIEALLTTLENNFKCKIYPRWKSNDDTFILKMILKEIPDNMPFTPIKTKSVTEMYFGMCYDYTIATGDFKELAHALITGRSGSGKTVAAQTALTNHIYYYGKNLWELYLAQLSDKKDVGIFKDVEQCRYYADNIIEVYKLLNYLKLVQKQRNELFDQYYNSTGKYIPNIYSYNKNNSKKKLRQIFLWSDEFACYQPRANDNKETLELKEKCLAILTSLFQEGRSVGIHVIGSLQRPDKSSLDANMKAQVGIKISFHQPNQASSLVVLDDTSACNLKKTREAIVDSDDRYLMKTLWLEEDDIAKWIKHRIDKSHSNYIDLDKSQKNKKNSHEEKQRKRTREYNQKKLVQNEDNVIELEQKPQSRVKVRGGKKNDQVTSER